MQTQTIDELEWGRIRDAQRAYPASRSTYYNWIKTRRGFSRRIGGARYVCMSSLKELFESAPEKPEKAISREMKKRARASAKKRAELAASKNGEMGT
jgi:hypothetical protein